MWELDYKESEQRRFDAFELWCWRRLLRVLWTARRSNQSILKEINPEYSLKGLMLMPKTNVQYFEPLMQRNDLFQNTLMLGKTEGGRRRRWQRMRCLDGITDLMDIEFEYTLGIGDGQGGLACCSPWGCIESEPLSNWTELKHILG